MMKHYLFIRKTYPEIAWGGCEIQVLNALKKIDYSKCKVTLAINFDIYSKRLKEANLPVNVVIVPFDLKDFNRGRFSKMLKFLTPLKPTRAIFIQGSFPDFSFSDFWAGFIATKGSVYSWEMLGAPVPEKKCNDKLINLNLWWHKRMFLYAMRGWVAQKTLTVGKEIKNRLVEWYQYPSQKIYAVYNKIDTQTFCPDTQTKQAMRQQLGISPTDTVLISTGRFSEEKNVDWLIRAYEKLRHEIPALHLILIGEGALRGQLEKLASSIDHKGRIRFLGFQEHVADYLKMSDIFTLSSSVEGLSTALMEAMATELLVVVTKTSGTKELIDNELTGYSTAINEDEYFHTLRNACLMPATTRETIGKNAREKILKLFQENPTNPLELLKIENI